MRRLLGRALTRAARAVERVPAPGPLDQLAAVHAQRFEAYRDATAYVDGAGIDGAILEFGVFAGASLALLAHAHRLSRGTRRPARQVAGYDSFAGLPAAADEHARWGTGEFATNRWWHPTLPIGGRVTPQATLDLFAACGLEAPEIVAGPFAETLARTVPKHFPEIALLHVDCDIYESTRTVLFAVVPALADGCMVLFDDWFLYRGHPGKGESRAFAELLAAHPEWRAAHYRTYGSFGNAFILYRPASFSETRP